MKLKKHLSELACNVNGIGLTGGFCIKPNQVFEGGNYLFDGGVSFILFFSLFKTFLNFA